MYNFLFTLAMGEGGSGGRGKQECGGRRITCRSWFSPTTLCSQVVRIGGKCLDLQRHLACPGLATLNTKQLCVSPAFSAGSQGWDGSFSSAAVP